MISKGKQHILNSALKVFAEKGFDDTSMRAIATAANLTTGAIYHHYKNKDDLFYAAVKEAAYFVHNLSEKDQHKKVKSNAELLEEISNRVKDRMSKDVEQRLLILLAAYALSKGGKIKDKYKKDYEEIIQKVADMYFYTFGVENKELQKALAAILVAALDGVAIQYSLGVLKLNDEAFKEIFVNFFTESIPLYIRNHSK